jgi:LPPG:FO 2-phospho-L-lactate transferase
VALNKVVVLVGGVGGAKLAHGLAQILEPEQLTVIVNTGDDFWHTGLRICPDLDTVTYTLAGLVDKTNGWGLAGDTTNTLEALRRLGDEAWFRLGDKDIATHLLRTAWLRDGERLTTITQKLTKRLGINHPVLPMTDAPVATMIDTDEYGELEFQTYFVRYRWQPTLKRIRLDGIDTAAMTPEVRDALENADIILFGPSNPWLSIAPILAVPGLRDLVQSRDIPRVAISPIVEGQALKGPAAKLMAELGYQPSADNVAQYYADVINGFVYDQRDADLRISRPRAITFDTIMQSEADRATLAGKVLGWIESWQEQ